MGENISAVSKEEFMSGWPDWAIFHQLGYFWRLVMLFWKDEVAQIYGDILVSFLFKQIFYILT